MTRSGATVFYGLNGKDQWVKLGQIESGFLFTGQV